MPLGNVVCGSDFTSSARAAAARAAMLPIGRGSSITLAHSISPGLPRRVTQMLLPAARVELEADRHAVVAALARAGRSDVDVFANVALGSPIDVLDGLAHDTHAELVVVGRGHGFGAGARLGAVAAQLARASDRAVLVVAAAPEGPYVRPLAAIDLSERSRTVLDSATQLCPEAHSIAVVHAYLAPSAAERERMRDSGIAEHEIAAWMRGSEDEARVAAADVLATLERPGVRMPLTVAAGDARAAIVGEATRLRADLVVVATRGHSRLGRWLFGSVADHVLGHAPCDVLVVR